MRHEGSPVTPAMDGSGLGSIEDYRIGTLRLARLLGAGGAASIVAGLVLLTSVPSGLASCLDALPTIPGIARVTMIYGWYVAYRYIKLRRAHVSSATAQATAGLPVAASELPSGIASALEKLARLHRDGAINDDEFVAAKRRLLDT